VTDWQGHTRARCKIGKFIEDTFIIVVFFGPGESKIEVTCAEETVA